MSKRVIAVTPLDSKIENLAKQCEQRVLAIWACDCVERVLHYFEDIYPDDERPRQAVQDCRQWIETGIFKMADVRKSALDAHAAARSCEDFSASKAVARAAGQAMGTAHVAGHAVACARYATTAVRNANPTNSEQAILAEREWQHQRLVELSANDIE